MAIEFIHPLLILRPEMSTDHLSRMPKPKTHDGIHSSDTKSCTETGDVNKVERVYHKQREKQRDTEREAEMPE